MLRPPQSDQNPQFSRQIARDLSPWTPGLSSSINLKAEWVKKPWDRQNLDHIPVYAETPFDDHGNYVKPLPNLPLSDEQLHWAFKFLNVEERTEWAIDFNGTSDIRAERVAQDLSPRGLDPRAPLSTGFHGLLRPYRQMRSLRERKPIV